MSMRTLSILMISLCLGQEKEKILFLNFFIICCFIIMTLLFFTFRLVFSFLDLN